MEKLLLKHYPMHSTANIMADPRNNELITFLSEKFGDQVALQVWQEFEGTQVYIPRFPKKVDKRQMYLLKNINTKSLRDMAKDLDLSSRQVYRLLQKPVRPHQTTLFG